MIPDNQLARRVQSKNIWGLGAEASHQFFFRFSQMVEKMLIIFFFRRGHICMKDAECAVVNEKSIFRFLVFEIWSILYSKLLHFLRILSTKSTITQKTRNLKVYFTFLSAHCASFIRIGPFLKGRGGGVRIIN